jgi:hypothetical protein
MLDMKLSAFGKIRRFVDRKLLPRIKRECLASGSYDGVHAWWLGFHYWNTKTHDKYANHGLIWQRGKKQRIIFMSRKKLPKK